MNDRSLALLNRLPRGEAVAQLVKCCGARTWVEAMSDGLPVVSQHALLELAEACFDRLERDDWLEAFACHPKIGDFNSLRMKFAGNKDWSAGEQAGVEAAEEETLRALAAGNAAYETRFGYLFIVCATGKSAAEMLDLLRQRLCNNPTDELPVAAREQRKITQLRLEKLELEPR
jgi:2-oxo-4-hydroxy-4-carboxy-5-ureidoimidazoline decarboxylase